MKVDLVSGEVKSANETILLIAEENIRERVERNIKEEKTWRRVHISLKGYKEVSIMHAKRGSATDHEYYYLYRASLDKNRRKGLCYFHYVYKGSFGKLLDSRLALLDVFIPFISSLCLPSLLITRQNIFGYYI